MKTTRRQLRKIIKEEKQKLLTEASYVHEVFSQAATALQNRDAESLERLLAELGDFLMDSEEQRNYRAALEAMLDAAYELGDLEGEY